MSGFNPSQVSFAGGEISPRLKGRVDADLYQRSLARCENFIPLPHGPVLMRAGSKDTGQSGAGRLIPFNVSGGEPFGLILTNLQMVVRDYLGALVNILANLVTNGTFDQGVITGIPTGWTVSGFDLAVGGFARAVLTGKWIQQTVSWTNARSYTVRYRARSDGGTMRVVAGQSGLTYGLDLTNPLTAQWQTFSHTFTATGTAVPGWDTVVFTSTGAGTFWHIDDVFVTDNGTAATGYLVTPWTSAQLAAIQFDQDLTRNRMLLVHGNVPPRLLTRNVHGLWEISAAYLTGTPTNWGGANWPSIIDWGFQGRLWLGATPDEPNVVNGSKSGYPFDFTTGVTASEGWTFTASVRGAIRWLQGQKSLLMGAERAEQAASGGGAVMWTANANVEDESAFGSAPIQAAHLGDEVVFVARNRRDVRALSFDARTKNGWVTRALSFVAEHLVRDVKELHYAASPVPMILLVLNDGSMVGCVYNRAEDVTAWWRVPFGGLLTSACVVETTNGAELWIAVTRGATVRVEIVPLHEIGVGYLDAMRTGVLPPATGGTTYFITGADHLEGNTVGVFVDGEYRGSQAFSIFHSLELLATDAGKTYVIGLPFRATAKQLPLEGGLQTGSSQSAKRRRTKVRLRLNNSALPLVNGKRAPERAPADPMDTGTDLVTGDVDYQVLGWEDDGALTIEQELPFRTEVLAIFGNATAQEI